MKLLHDNELWKISAINTHCHHLHVSSMEDVNLHAFLQITYNSWILPNQENTPEGRAYFFSQMAANSYFSWWKTAIETLYGDGRALDPDTWSWYDARLRLAYKNPQHDINVLLHDCSYSAILLDDYKNPGIVDGKCDIMHPIFRCDMFLCGIAEGTTDENGNHAYDYFTKIPRNLADYLAETKGALIKAKASGVVGIKIAIAYERSLNFKLVSTQKAEECFGRNDATLEQRRDFSDYMMFAIADMAAELALPIQIHTGLGIMDESRAICLRTLIHNKPHTQFDLFHGSYPWCDDVLGLAHNYRNVYINLCWLPLISTTRAKSFLREAWELVDAGHLLWGCDTWTSEESYGSRMALHHCICETANFFITKGIITHAQALNYAQALLHDNAAKLYQL